MVTTYKLEDTLEKCGINMEFATSILGHYYCDGKYYIILNNKSLESNESLCRTVSAEEISHYRIIIGDKTPRKYMCFMDKLEVAKHKLKTFKWTTDFLVPTSMPLDYIRKQISVVLVDLVDYFYVIYDFIMKKLKSITK